MSRFGNLGRADTTLVRERRVRFGLHVLVGFILFVLTAEIAYACFKPILATSVPEVRGGAAFLSGDIRDTGEGHATTMYFLRSSHGHWNSAFLLDWLREDEAGALLIWGHHEELLLGGLYELQIWALRSSGDVWPHLSVRVPQDSNVLRDWHDGFSGVRCG